MNRSVTPRIALLVLSVAVLGVLTACAGRRVTTSIEDQTFVPGPSPQAAVPSVSPPVPKERPKVAVPAPTKPVEATRIIEPPSALPPRNEPGDLVDVYFDYDQFLLGPDERATLELNAELIKIEGARTILIEGHCDERGTLAYNLVLGERRARAVTQYLQDLGVPASQLKTTSYGKERPFCTEHSEACWQSNRRAHFRP